MTAKDYVFFVMKKNKGKLFCQACQKLGLSFKEARKKTPFFRADELIAMAFKGSSLTRKFFLRNLFPGKDRPTPFRRPLSCQNGNWEGFGLYNLLPWSLKRDSHFDFFCRDYWDDGRFVA